MTVYQKFLFDNFVLDDTEDKPAVIEVPEPETLISVPEEADNVESEAVELPEEAEEEQTPPPAEPEVVMPPVIQGYTEEEVAEKVRQAAEEAYRRGREEVAEEAYQRGKNEGAENAYQKSREEAAAEAEKVEKTLLNQVDEKLSGLFDKEAVLTKELSAQFHTMAVALLRQLVPTVLAENAEMLVKGFLEENFKNFFKEAKLSFYFNPGMIGKAQEIIGRLAHVNDFEGKITLHKDAALALEDCRVEWEDGGVERKSSDMLEKAEKLLDTEAAQPME